VEEESDRSGKVEGFFEEISFPRDALESSLFSHRSLTVPKNQGRRKPCRAIGKIGNPGIRKRMDSGKRIRKSRAK